MKKLSSIHFTYLNILVFIEIINQLNKNTVIGLINRPNSTEPRADIGILFAIMDIMNTRNKVCVIIGDMNIDLLKFGSHIKTYPTILTTLPVITKATRITITSVT